jgi:hypothetical protein
VLAGNMGNTPLMGLAQLYLARAYAQQNDAAKPAPRIRIFWPCGKMPTPTSPS